MSGFRIKKSLFVSFLLIFFLQSCSTFISEKVYVVNKDILAILSELEISNDRTIEDIVRVTQKKLLRPSGKERWEINDRYAYKKDKLLPLLRSAGLIDEVLPKKMSYKHVLLLGANIFSARRRVAFLIKLFEKGVRFNSIIILTGQRKLSESLNEAEATVRGDCEVLPIKAGWKFVQKMPETETDMFKIVFDQAVLLDQMRKIPIIYVDATEQRTKNGLLRRPNTADTVVEFLKISPDPGSYLVISNQPFVLYQDSVMKSLLDSSFEIETVGSGYRLKNGSFHVSMILDAFARFLYQENRRIRSNQRYKSILY